jgi:hypothetical protein
MKPTPGLPPNRSRCIKRENLPHAAHAQHLRTDLRYRGILRCSPPAKVRKKASAKSGDRIPRFFMSAYSPPPLRIVFYNIMQNSDLLICRVNLMHDARIAARSIRQANLTFFTHACCLRTRVASESDYASGTSERARREGRNGDARILHDRPH